MRSEAGLDPGGGGQLGKLPVGRRGEPGEEVAQVVKWVQAPPAAALDDRVDDRPPLAGVSLADEEPVLLADRRRADRVLDRIMPPAGLCRVVGGSRVFSA